MLESPLISKLQRSRYRLSLPAFRSALSLRDLGPSWHGLERHPSRLAKSIQYRCSCTPRFCNLQQEHPPLPALGSTVPNLGRPSR
ncbi:Uncharacterised protein [Vibrio cholerae]|uniref:Uncharacterized protein n=1 Tax=Vibrio cholerae TaxID=666 RepID=A0A656A9Y1_VIBCL|nr:Uncharacterised protein [Vibrio cholerae]CSC99196.1 Uncharacterised protein [Vibrio cholerae]